MCRLDLAANLEKAGIAGQCLRLRRQNTACNPARAGQTVADDADNKNVAKIGLSTGTGFWRRNSI
jgi:hypothetical protein